MANGNSKPTTGFFDISIIAGKGSKKIPIQRWDYEVDYTRYGCKTKQAWQSFERCDKNEYPYEATTGRGCAAHARHTYCWKDILAGGTHFYFGANTRYANTYKPPEIRGVPGTENKKIGFYQSYKEYYGGYPLVSDFKLDTPNGKIDSLPVDANDDNWMVNNKPFFTQIIFRLPDPFKPNIIDGIIPLILIEYDKEGLLNPNEFYNYMSAYVFSLVPTSDGKGMTQRGTVTDATGVPQVSPNFVAAQWNNYKPADYAKAAQDYCKGDALTTDFCYNYCKNTSNNCTINLEAFCKTGGDGGTNFPKIVRGVLPQTKISLTQLQKAFPKYYDDKSKNVCGCFMPQTFYQANNVHASQENNTDPDDYKYLYNAGAIGGTPKNDPFTTCSQGADVVQDINDKSAKNVYVQKCSQINNLSINGDAKDNTFQNEQSMDCVMNVDNQKLPSSIKKEEAEKKLAEEKAIAEKKLAEEKALAEKKLAAPTPVVGQKVSSGTPPTKSKTTPPKMSPAIIAAIIVVLILLLGGGLFFIL